MRQQPPALVLAIILACPIPSQAKESQLLAGAVVVFDSTLAVDSSGLVHDLGGARWRVETVHPRTRERQLPTRVSRGIGDLRSAYLEADFLRCLAILRRPMLGVDRLLESGHRLAAAQVQLWTAACAHGANDLDLAWGLIRQALRQELPIEVGLAETRPDFQNIVEEGRRAASQKQRVTLTVRTRPAGAELFVDGKRHCRMTPCTLRLWPGEHILAATKIGHARRTTRQTAGKGAMVDLALDKVSAEGAGSQLQELAAQSGVRLDSIDIGRLASNAVGVPIVVLAWHHRGKGHAVLYDRSRDQLKTHVSVLGDVGALERAIRAAVKEWQQDLPRPFYHKPWFYIVVAGAAGLTALVTYFTTRADTVRHDVVFR